MTDIAVTFEGVWKKFRLGERHDSLRDLIPSLARGLLSKRRPEDLEEEEFWAIRDVSFNVKQGQALGIIGPNGAGKSTALKLLTKILKPTRGRSVVRGRVGALIEVAAGFHPDLTGRENIFLQGAIMGMKRWELTQKLDQIIEFSGVRDFIETPVKRYSSGMSARLGFSIAAHLDPDVLLIDEVLAVGDAAFQQRCIDRILALKRQGTTFVFVSHNLLSIETVCDATLVLQRGTTRFLGEPREATSLYMSSPRSLVKAGVQSPTVTRRGSQAVQITSATFTGNGCVGATSIPSGSPLEAEVGIACIDGPKEIVLGLILHDADYVALFGENSSIKARPFTLESGEQAVCRITFDSLALPMGHYHLTLALHSPLTFDIYDWHDAAYQLEIEPFEDSTRNGRLCLETHWAVERRAAVFEAKLAPEGLVIES